MNPVPGCLKAEAGEALEDDAGEIVPVADEVGEDADEQRLLDEPRDDVVIGAPRPEQRRQRHIDDDQRGGDEGDLAAEQAEAAVDVAGEDLEEMVDDAGAAHGFNEPPAAECRGPCAMAKSFATLRPGPKTNRVTRTSFAETLTADQLTSRSGSDDGLTAWSATEIADPSFFRVNSIAVAVIATATKTTAPIG